MPACYAVLYRVFDELHLHLPHFAPKTMLDFGSGPGTAIWAAREVGPAQLAAVAVMMHWNTFCLSICPGSHEHSLLAALAELDPDWPTGRRSVCLRQLFSLALEKQLPIWSGFAYSYWMWQDTSLPTLAVMCSLLSSISSIAIDIFPSVFAPGSLCHVHAAYHAMTALMSSLQCLCVLASLHCQLVLTVLTASCEIHTHHG